MGRMPDLTCDTVTTLAGLANALSDCLNGPPGLAEDRAPEIGSAGCGVQVEPGRLVDPRPDDPGVILSVHSVAAMTLRA
jgi:hypothetical protein